MVTSKLMKRPQPVVFVSQDSYCRFRPDGVAATAKGYTDLRSGDEDTLEIGVGTVGPISVAVDAGHDSFMHYSNGKSPKFSLFFRIRGCKKEMWDSPTFLHRDRTDSIVGPQNPANKYLDSRSVKVRKNTKQKFRKMDIFDCNLVKELSIVQNFRFVLLQPLIKRGFTLWRMFGWSFFQTLMKIDLKGLFAGLMNLRSTQSDAKPGTVSYSAFFTGVWFLIFILVLDVLFLWAQKRLRDRDKYVCWFLLSQVSTKSPTAALQSLTMPCWLSGTAMREKTTIGWSKTAGARNGGKRVQLYSSSQPFIRAVNGIWCLYFYIKTVNTLQWIRLHEISSQEEQYVRYCDGSQLPFGLAMDCISFGIRQQMSRKEWKHLMHIVLFILSYTFTD